MIVESFLSFLGRIFCFTSYVNNKGSFPRPLTPEEERQYLARAAEGDLEAREALIRHNLRLVAHIVKKYSGAGEADDLISVGSIGLIKGIESFEYGKGSQLATYAAKCIENEILMYIRANKKHRAAASLSEAVGVDKEGNEITLMEILPAPDDFAFGRIESDIMLSRVLAIIPSTLSRREAKIVAMRYGLMGEKPHTQSEAAARLGISRSYVSRIEKKAMEKLRRKMEE